MALLKELPVTTRKGWPWDQETHPYIYNLDVKWPKISIVTPSFNQGIYIEETIRSILLQNYPNLEYIIIDGGSSDQTVEIIKRYEPWISGWVSEPDNGQSHAINKGIGKCTGEIFNWLNSDDFLAQGALFEVGLKASESDIEKIIFGNINFIYSNKETKREGSKIFKNLGKTIGYGSISQPATFFPLKFIKIIGGVNEHLDFTMDVDLFIKYILQTEDFLVTSKIIANFRFHDESKTVSHNIKFQNDLATIYYEIAKSSKLKKQQILLLKLYPGLNSDFKTNYKISNQKIAKSAVNYFLLKQTFWLYHSLTKYNLTTFYRHLFSIDKKVLERVDKKWLIKTYFKSTLFLPIIISYRKLLKIV